MVETVKIRMTLDKAAADKHSKALETLNHGVDDKLRDGDNLRVTYDFYIHYLGDIVRNLIAIHEICSNPDVVIEASCDRLEEGKILAYETLKQLDRVISIVKGRG